MSKIETATTTRTRSGKRPPPRPASLSGTARRPSAVDDAAEVALDDTDEEPMQTEAADTDTDTPKPKGKGTAARGNAAYKGQPAHLRKAAVFENWAERIGITIHGKEGSNSVEMDGWIEDPELAKAKDLASTAQAQLLDAAKILKSKGKDFVAAAPRTRRSPTAEKKKLTSGTTCRLKEQYRKGEDSYASLLEDEEMDNLTFQRKAGNKMLFQTPAGAKVLLKRHEVEIVPTAVAE